VSETAIVSAFAFSSREKKLPSKLFFYILNEELFNDFWATFHVVFVKTPSVSAKRRQLAQNFHRFIRFYRSKLILRMLHLPLRIHFKHLHVGINDLTSQG
jgi:hypothetical protein